MSGSMRSVICFFGPGQTIAFAKKSGPSSGLSERSIFSSRIASIRFQSVLDRLFVFFAFIAGGLSQGDDANRFRIPLGEDNLHGASTDLTQSRPASFSVVLSGIGFCEKNAAEYFFRVGKVQSMFTDVRAILGLVPFQSHCNSKCSYIKRFFADSFHGSIILSLRADSFR